MTAQPQSQVIDGVSVPVSSVPYRPAIDGLRAVAVLAVLVFHLNRRWLPGGFVGVDIFFVISGYLITSILLREHERQHFSIGKFYQRRIARLFPAFFTAALATLIAAFFIYSNQDFASCASTLVSASLSVANMKYLWQGNYFTISRDAQPLLHYWSLSVEEQFYLLFPALFSLLYWNVNRLKTIILAAMCGVSLTACIALTHTRPEWAFFLLPTRAWELLAGSILANFSANRSQSDNPKILWDSLPFVGMALIALSLFVIKEDSAFPGYIAVLPVLGTIFLLGPNKGSSGLPERLLSWSPMVLIGRMSYSLYLWHWPVFSMVDYKLYRASPLVRVGLKIVLSLGLAGLCFFLIENPGRVFLNNPRRRRLAFAFLGGALLAVVPLGIAIRREYYVNAEMRDVPGGGLVFNKNGKNGSIALMGDSNGSMYGKTMKEVATALGLRLNVISVAAGDPLPRSSGQQPPLWLDSLAVVKREKPDYLVLVCNWREQLKGDKNRLDIAIKELTQYAHRLILITQPPELPDSADRESIRNGSRPPFMEDPVERAVRVASNAMVKNLSGDNVTVIDIERLFAKGDGEIVFADSEGNQLYQDRDHLSGAGAEVVRTRIAGIMMARKTT